MRPLALDDLLPLEEFGTDRGLDVGDAAHHRGLIDPERMRSPKR